MISINAITGEYNIIQKSQEYSGFMGHAFSILREFRINGDFKETGSRIWG